MKNIKKFLRAILPISLSIFFFTVSFHSISAKVEYKVEHGVLKRKVVKIKVYKYEDMLLETGAGIIVNIKNNIAYILTAYHVVKDVAEDKNNETIIKVVFFDAQFFEFNGQISKNIVSKKDELDMAIITVDLTKEEGRNVPTSLPKFTFGDFSKLQKKDEVLTIGHPLDSEWKPSHHSITELDDINNLETRKFLFKKEGKESIIERGNSGGPVFNKQSHLIGMVTDNDVGNSAIAVKIDIIRLALEKWNILVPTSELKWTLNQRLMSSAVSLFPGLGLYLFQDRRREGLAFAVVTIGIGVLSVLLSQDQYQSTLDDYLETRDKLWKESTLDLLGEQKNDYDKAKSARKKATTIRIAALGSVWVINVLYASWRKPPQKNITAVELQPKSNGGQVMVHVQF